ncbi:putative Pi-transporter A-1 [Protomyces lactucae-debilis]|uniref:Putative Pi-transporter A-1 n=1 Tax=Protomyces lactucae-debilis TaxID=2754530 RepID=A0A1Y2F7I1_PROLT|nr:putative Pi-transporter A-1 [Protomyces lactucae-debilis]ORY79862.1 putative Pi-transporter A-1 [Protomyces lactucae-debilis]
MAAAEPVSDAKKLDTNSLVGTPAELDHVLYPTESYAGRTYWADLPFRQRAAWIHHQESSEAKREFRIVWEMFKRDPLEPMRRYFGDYVVPGMGLFTEGYILFSIGNLAPLFAAVWPQCWGKSPSVCNPELVNAVSYLEIVGIMIGQVLVGVLIDKLGRRYGLVQDAVILFLGTVMLAASWGKTLQGWVIMYMISLFFYGIGVGGEYPVTSSQQTERVLGRRAKREDRLHRGRKVQLAFLMQGWGQLANQALLIICLLIFHGGSSPPYTKTSTQYTFRVQFGIIGAVSLWLCYHRFYKVKDANKMLNQSKKKHGVSGYDIESFKLTLRVYGHRLIGTSIAWFANDIFFYGNKIFQSTFISAITGKSGPDVVFTNWLWNGVNILVSLAGYYLAAFLIDCKWYGRKRMQMIGFLAGFILFVAAAAKFDYLSTQGTVAFQCIYFLSSFFQQLGANATTFLLAAEVFPTSVRSSAHGFAAASGKLGALVAAIAYNYIDTETKLWVVCWFGLLGAIITWLFIPDVTGLDLEEQERYFTYIRQGQGTAYHGLAVHRCHLSNWEIYVLKKHLQYDGALDAQAKIVEMRDEYRQWKQERAQRVMEGSQETLEMITEKGEPQKLQDHEDDAEKLFGGLDHRTREYFENEEQVADDRPLNAQERLEVADDQARTTSLLKAMNKP